MFAASLPVMGSGPPRECCSDENDGEGADETDGYRTLSPVAGAISAATVLARQTGIDHRQSVPFPASLWMPAHFGRFLPRLGADLSAFGPPFFSGD